MTIDYRICVGRSTMELEVQVQELIELGYLPQGGISIAPGGLGLVYAQAMARRKPKLAAESDCG